MMKTEIIFLGPPASGKGTQTERLSKDLNLPHIDTGKLLRAEIAAGTEDGKIAKGFIDQGQLVPANLAAQIIIKKIFSKEAENGYILDGFPRSIEQAEILEKKLEETGKANSIRRIVVNLFVDKAALLDRIVNRRMCKDCNRIYNLKSMPPKVANICDGCGADLYQRSDDTEEIATKRFDTYNKQTAPVIEYYKKKNLIVDVDGNKTPDEIYKNILDVIK